jgi:hypothetical protein
MPLINTAPACKSLIKCFCSIGSFVQALAPRPNSELFASVIASCRFYHKHGGDRAKQLFAIGRAAKWNVGQDCGWIKITGAIAHLDPANQRLGSFFDRHTHLLVQVIQDLWRCQGTNVGVLVHRIANVEILKFCSNRLVKLSAIS